MLCHGNTQDKKGVRGDSSVDSTRPVRSPRSSRKGTNGRRVVVPLGSEFILSFTAAFYGGALTGEP